MLRAKLFLLLPFLLVGVFFPSLTLAVSGDFGLNATRVQAGLPTTVAGQSNFAGILGAVVAVGLGALGMVFFLIILYSGFNWMTAMGNSEKVDKSKEIIQGAIIGLVLVMAAYAISSFVFTSLAQGPQAAATPSTLCCPQSASPEGSGTLNECNAAGGTVVPNSPPNSSGECAAGFNSFTSPAVCCQTAENG